MCEHPYSLLYRTFKQRFGFTALQDYFSHFKQSQMVKWSEYQIFPRKTTLLDPQQIFFFGLIFDPTRARTHSGELTEWFRDSSLTLLSPRQTEMQYIHEEWQIFIENCLCFIQLGLLYEQKSCTYNKSCMQQVLTTWKAVWTDLKTS